MSKPHHPDSPFLGKPRCFFVTTRCASGKSILKTDRMASLFVDVLRSYVRQRKFIVHDFVVMPDHVHILLTVPAEMNLESAIQLIKGGFSYRAKKDLGYCGDVWQRGFSDVYVPNAKSFRIHQIYIQQNPVRAGLAGTEDEYPFASAYLKKMKKARAEARPSDGEPMRHD